jgi:hypothetical protein
MEGGMLKVIILLASLFIAIPVAAETYSWEDKNGVHFVDDLSKVPKKYRNKVTERGEMSGTGNTNNHPSFETNQENSNPVHYSSSNSSSRGTSSKELEKRRLMEKLRYYENDCLRRESCTKSSRGSSYINSCERSCGQGAEKIKRELAVLEKDEEYYNNNKQIENERRSKRKMTLGVDPSTGKTIPIIPIR